MVGHYQVREKPSLENDRKTGYDQEVAVGRSSRTGMKSGFEEVPVGSSAE